MKKDEQLVYQRKVILEEYHEHLALQKREVRNEKCTVSRFGQVMQAGQRAGEARV
jgi:hypothetical protein